MEGDNADSEKMNIRCPNCRLRFSLDPSLMNRIVECGGCDTQFRITDEVIIHSKRVYPGEKNEPELNQFRRIPLTSVEAPKGLQTINYAEFNHPEQLGPASPLRIIAGVCGIIIMALGALLLFISTKSTSPMGGMPFEKKLIIAGFTSLLGFIFLIYANPRAQIKAAFIGLLFAAGVFSIPIYIKEQPTKPKKPENASEESDLLPTEAQAVDPIRALRERFVTQPLENEQIRLADSITGKKAYGIYITEMLGRNKLTARDYLIRETGANLSSHPFPRSGDNYLMVLAEVEMDFDQVADIAGKLGKTSETYPEIGVVVVKVDNEQFISGSAEKLNDRNHPLFYQLNRLELQSIDISRVELAVDRLADSDATLLRSDITAILIELLGKPRITFHDSIARALIKWAEDIGPAAEVGLKTLQLYTSKKISPPEHLVKLVAKHNSPKAIPVMISIWENNTVLWDSELVKFGSAIESPVLERLSSNQAPLVRAAIKILGQVGTAQSIPELRKFLNEKDPELSLLAERAIQQIEQR
jgi:hypothetical protein